jgi:regulatory protein
MKITDLRPQKRSSRRVSVFINGRYAFGMDQELALQLQLRVGSELDAARVQQIIVEVEHKKALDASFKLLSFRRRSRKELADRLQRKEFNSGAIAATIQKLAALGLLDDTKFAEALARDRLELGHKGKRQIYADLRRKGIPKLEIERALERAGDETEVARTLLAKVARRYAGLAPRERYRKLHDLLLRRGFSFDAVRRVLAEEEKRAATAEIARDE